MHQTYAVCDLIAHKLQQYKHLYYFILSASEWSVDNAKFFLIRKYY